MLTTSVVDGKTDGEVDASVFGAASVTVAVVSSESSVVPLDSLVEALEVSAIVVVTVVAVVCAMVSVVVVSSEGGLMRSQPQDFAQCLAMYSRFAWHAPMLAQCGQNR